MYADSLLRGLSQRECITDGYVTAAAFQFAPAEREDNYEELSINWFDDDGAKENLFSRTKSDGKLQFKEGIAEINLSNMLNVLHDHIATGRFCYERKDVGDGNKYHGNLLLNHDTPKPIRNLITSGLCLVAGTNISKNPNTSNT